MPAGGARAGKQLRVFPHDTADGKGFSVRRIETVCFNAELGVTTCDFICGCLRKRRVLYEIVGV